MKTILCGIQGEKIHAIRVMPELDNRNSNVSRAMYLTADQTLEVRTYRYDGLNFHRTRVPLETVKDF